MKRILVVSVNWLGDAILTTPSFKALKEAHPSSYVAVMSVDRVRPVFEDNPYIDEIIIFDERTLHRGVFQKLKFIQLLKKKKFDTVFFLHRSFTRVLVCLLAGINTRIGYRRAKTFFILTKRIKQTKGAIHRQDRYLYLFEREGIKVSERLPQFFIRDSVREAISAHIRPIREKSSCIAGIHAAGNWRPKLWPKEYFAQLSERLINELDCAVFFTGSQKDCETVSSIISLCRSPVNNLCGKLNLKELGAFFENLDIFISNDSGPAHLAAAQNAHTLVLFGPTSQSLTVPKGKHVHAVARDIDCRIPCYKSDCLDNRCMRNISVNDVFAEAKKILIANGR